MMRSVRHACRPVEEERPRRIDATPTVDHRDRFVGHVGAQVIVALVGYGDGRMASQQRRREIVGIRRDEAVEPLEALARRPLVEGAGGCHVGRRHVIPLADRESRVAAGFQVVGQRTRRSGDVPGIAANGKGGNRVRADVDAVRIAPGQEGRAGGGADRRGVVVGVAQAHARHAIDVRSGHEAAEAGNLRIADIVHHPDQHVGALLLPLAWLRCLHRRGARRRLGGLCEGRAACDQGACQRRCRNTLNDP